MLLPEAGSIRGRLLGSLGLLFGCGMIALYLAATSYARFAADSSYDRLLLGSAGSITETLSVTPGEVRADIPYSALDMLAAAPDDRVFYRVIGTEGSIDLDPAYDYSEGLEGAQFVIKNPNATTTCGCGSSFTA